MKKVVDVLREHIEEWDSRENNDDDIDDNNEANDAIIKHIKEKLHGLSPDIRNFQNLLIFYYNNIISSHYNQMINNMYCILI